MSRGHGEVERYILEMVGRYQKLIPTVVIAEYYAAGVEVTPHLRSSVRRAANRLAQSGEVIGWEVRAPTRRYLDGRGWAMGAHRWVFCVGPPGLEVTTEDEQDALTAMFNMVMRG
jgi:hypothetical protein